MRTSPDPPGPVPLAPVPLPALGSVLAPGIAAARQDLLRALGPVLPEGSTFAREVRIAARRLRTLFAPLVPPDGRGPVPGLRRGLGRLIEGLSSGRDLEVVVQWLTRDEGWRTGEEILRRELLGRLVPAPDPAPDPAPREPEAGPERARAEVAALAGTVAEAVRAHLPEELHRPVPTGVPGVWLGDEPEDPLPRPKLLRRAAPSAREVVLARAWLETLLAEAGPGLGLVDDAGAEPEAYHRLRRAWRRIRYVLEALEYSWPGLARPREAVHRFVSTLGALQDRRVIREQVEAVPEGEGAVRQEGRRDLLGRLDREERELKAEARELARRKLAAAPLARALAKGLGLAAAGAGDR